MCVVDDGLGQTKEHIKVFPAFLWKLVRANHVHISTI